MSDNYALDILGGLQQSKSKKQINSDIKQLEKAINMLRLTATFAKADTKRELNSYITQLSNQLSTIKLKAKIDNKTLKSEVNKALSNLFFKDIDTLNIDENKTKLKVQKIFADVKTYAEKNPIVMGINISSKKNKLDNDLTTYLNKYTKINESSVLLEEANKVRDLIDAITDKKSLTEATDAFRLFKSECAATGYTSKSTADKVKSMLGHITKIGSAFGVASMLINNFTKSLKTLRENDTILTEISKTSEMTKNQLRELGDEAFKVASKFGQLSSNYLLSVQEMARSGYEDMSKELGELSLLAQSAGEMTAENANNYLLATDAAYKYGGSVEKLNAALDGANYISNKNSASLTDISDAIRVSASFAANAGVAIDELTAAEATMIAATKRSGSEIGRSFRSIILNLQQVSGEFDGEIIDEEQLKKVEERCHSLGVELEYMKDGIATLRNPIDILKDLAEVYNSLPDNSAEKQGLIADLGGKYHANALSSLLSRWDLYEKMLSEFSQGAGSALEEAEKTANSWEGRLNSLQNSWDSFCNSLTNKEAIMGGVSFLDRLIQGAETLTNTIGEIPVVLTTLHTAMVAMKKDYGITQLLNKDNGKLDIQGNVFGIDFSAIKEQKKHFEEAEQAILHWNDKLSIGKADLDSYNSSIVQNNAQLKNYLSTCTKDAPASLSGYKAYLNAAGVSTDALRLKTILLNSAISLGIGTAIQLAVKGITYLIQREENLRQATEEAAKAYEDSASSIEDYASRYEELHKALIAAKGNEEETYAIKKQLLELQTELNNKFGEECGTLDLVTNAYESQTEAIRNLNKEKARLFLNENKEGIDKAEKEMTKDRHYNLSYTGLIGNTEKGKAIKELAEKYKEQGITLLDEYGDGTYLQFSIHLNADAQSAYDTINAFENDLRDKAKELGDENMFDDVLDISSDSLNKAKETIENYGDTYKQALTAEIVSDDDKSKTYGEALKAVEAYNEAVLRSENPYDDQNVTQAKENLDVIKASIQDNEAEWGKYSVLFDDVFKQADTRLLEFNETLKTDSGLKELANDLEGLSDIDLQALDENAGENNSFDKLKEAAAGYKVNVDELIDTLVRLGYVQGEIQNTTLNSENPISTFEDAWKNSFTSENESVKELANNLLELAEQGRLTKETFAQTDSTDYFKNLGISADEAISKINKLVDESKQLSSMASQISSISNALGTKQENGFVDANTLAGFDVEVRGLESWDRFQEVLGSTTSSYEECQEAANALATEWVNSSNFLAQLTEENKEYYETQLQAMGVENYEEVIACAQELNAAKEALEQASFDVATATNEEIQAFINEGAYSELAQQQIWNLVLAKQTEEGITLDTSADCQNLLALAQNAGVTGTAIELLTQLLEIYNNLAAGTYGTNAQVINAVKNKAESLKNQINDLLVNGANSDTVELDPRIKVSPSAKSAAKSAGKETGDAYKDGLKEALSDIESVISGVTKALDRQISSINSEKSAALNAIDEQKEAIENAKESALEAIETERNARLDAIEEQISSKQKTIDGINDEIKLMRDANSEREKQLALERAKFELERQQNQKTKLIYSSDKGLHYETDATGIANAREQVRQIEFEIEITNKEKEIDLLEKEIDLLNEQKDQINEYYDDLIKKTEAFYDSQLKNLEKQRKETEIYYESLTKSIEEQKAKYQELTELLEKAELSAKLKQLGIDEEALLNGSAEEFEKLKAAYLDIVYQLNAGNDEVLLKLQELSGYEGTAPTMLEESNDKLDTMNEKLGTANKEVSNVSSSLGETASTISTVATNVGSVVDELNKLPESGKVSGLAGEFETLAEKIEAVAKALGIGEGDTVGTLFHAMSNLNTITLGGETEGIIGQFVLLKNAIIDVIDTIGSSEEQTIGSLMAAITQLNSIVLDESIIAQFNNLKTAIDSVSSAISGGGESSGGEGQSGKSSSGKGGESGGKGSNGEGGGNSLTGAIESMGETANKIIGEPDAEGDGTVIGKFGSLETAVNDVASAIGVGESEGGKEQGKGKEDSDNLISSIANLGETTAETLGESGGDGVIGRFEQFKQPIQEAREHVQGIADGLAAIDGQTVECTIKINIDSDGIPAYASGTALGAMNLESSEYNAKYEGNAHVSGTANVTGNWGVRKPGKSLVGELGQEIWVHSADGTFETVGDNGPEWIQTEKDDLIFNHLQTKELLDKGNIVKTGKTYANGTVQYSDGTTILPDGSTLRPLQPGDKMYDMVQKFDAYFKSMDGNLEKLVPNSYYEHQRQMEDMAKQISYVSSVVNNNNNQNVQQPVVHNEIHVTLPNVTNSTSAESLLRDLQSINTKKYQMDW